MTISSFQIPLKKVLMYFLLVMSLIVLSSCSTTSQEDGPADDSDLVLSDEGSAEEAAPTLEAESTRSGFDKFDENSTGQAASTSEDDLLIDNEATQQKVAETQATAQDPSAAAAEDEFAQFDEASTVDPGAPLGEGAPWPKKPWRLSVQVSQNLCQAKACLSQIKLLKTNRRWHKPIQI